MILVTLACALAAALIWVIKDQGVEGSEWQNFKLAHVDFDRHGIPTITAKDWSSLIKAQGYVVASQRLWQMDLQRRLAAGRLSEWFGKATIKRDRMKLEQDWPGVAQRAVEDLTADERDYCYAYAAGINDFIRTHQNSWGIEYSLMRVEPEPWRCRDSILILMNMASFLTGTSYYDKLEAPWREKLTEEWQDFLFPTAHPWAHPLFGKKTVKPVKIPPEWQYLPREPLQEGPKEANHTHFEISYKVGSNAWAVTDSQTTFLAGDPHLRHSVPQVWYANRLRVSKTDWVVGASLPGIPGVVIGMNPAFAWTFTNLGDDVDDLLIETVDENKQQYLAHKQGDKEYWRPIVKKRLRLKVKGFPDEFVEAWFTHRGPLMKAESGERYFSRQWLSFKEGSLGLPVVAVNQARSWSALNAALDRMIAPSQCLLYADRKGRIGYRATGIDLERRVTGLKLQPAVLGEWQKRKSPSTRKRMILRAGKKAKFLVNANQQIWSEKFGHRWDSDDRRDRIARVLTSYKNFSLEQMKRLQHDTFSRYHRVLLRWVISLANPKTDAERRLLARWQQFKGLAESQPHIFTQAHQLDLLLTNTLLARVKRQFFSKKETADLPKYKSTMRRAWILRLTESERACLSFGVSCARLATYLVSEMAKALKSDAYAKKLGLNFRLYSEQNAWAVQHPFVSRIPVLGQLFQVASPEQTGFVRLVKAERSTYGPSMRLVWDLRKPQDSQWIFPIGQAGHLRSTHYRDQQRLWHAGQYVPMLTESLEWESVSH